MRKIWKLLCLPLALIFVVSLCGFAALPAGASPGGILNGGFESGDLSNWTVGGSLGHVEALTSTNFSPAVTVPEGNYFALLSAHPDDTGTPGVDIDGNSVPDHDTSTLSQQFVLNAAEVPAVLSFKWSFLTDEGSDEAYDDFFIVTVNMTDVLHGSVPEPTYYTSLFEDVQGLDGVYYSVSSTGLTNGSHFETGMSPFRTFTYAINTPGAYTLQFLVADQEDDEVDSALLIDEVKVELFGEGNVKWLQRPNIDDYGVDTIVDERGDPISRLADDFLCIESGPITGIRIWGGWWNDQPASTANFTVEFWSDYPDPDPTNPLDYSHPDQQLWSANFTAEEYTASLYSHNLTDETLWFPGRSTPSDIIRDVWQYDFSVDPAEAFIQEAGNVYWLLIRLETDEETVFGWKNSLDNWNDDAVWFSYGDAGPEWNELLYPDVGSPYTGDSMDLAFALYGDPDQASIGDFVWEDFDKDGIQDAGEPGVGGVTVNLYDSNDNMVGTTTTLAGKYGFFEVDAGDYYLEFILPSGYSFSPRDQGADDSADSDADTVTGRTGIFTVTTGGHDLTRDAGMYIPPDNKWIQPPDLSSSGLDIFNGVFLGEEAFFVLDADDFMCTESGFITNIRIWGSWAQDRVDPNMPFILFITPDIPASGEEFSRPDFTEEPLWSQMFAPGDYQSRLYAYGQEKFILPFEPENSTTDTQVWQYDFAIDPAEAFWQEEGTVYWLGVVTLFPEGFFGWKTSTNHWNDDAVYSASTWNLDTIEWEELRYPEFSDYAGNSIDLAFALYNATPNIEDPKTVELAVDADGNGVVSPGDTLRYTAVINNTGDAPATGVIFSDTPDIHTTLVVGSVTSVPPGVVTHGNAPGDTWVGVELGTIEAGGSATVTFDVKIKKPTYTSRIYNQALVQGDNFADVRSDDPGTEPLNDPTMILTRTSPALGVGGEVKPVDRLGLVLPWAGLVLAVMLSYFAGMRLIRRRRTG